MRKLWLSAMALLCGLFTLAHAQEENKRETRVKRPAARPPAPRKVPPRAEDSMVVGSPGRKGAEMGEPAGDAGEPSRHQGAAIGQRLTVESGEPEAGPTPKKTPPKKRRRARRSRRRH